MFIQTTPEWARFGQDLIPRMLGTAGPAGLDPDLMGLVVMRAGGTDRGGAGTSRPEGFVHRGDWRCYPCSLVKPFHLVHAIAALEEGRIQPHSELDRALRDMILWSSNTATNYVIDLITGTTGDTLLYGADYMDWCSKRERLDRWFETLGWAEWAGCSVVQKLMDDTRYGREAQFAGAAGEHLNVLTPLAAARLMWEMFEGDLPLSRPGLARAQAILSRNPAGPDAGDPNYQLSEYLGGDLPSGVRIWSKAGHNLWTGDARTSWYKHDMIRIAVPDRPALTVVLMTQGRALAGGAPGAFAALGRLIWDAAAGMDLG
ncbi:MAG: serine hydrolase [Paracoccaceae bacterium]